MASQYVVLDSDSIKVVPMRNDEIAEHFQSNALAEDYLNGLIDWDGNEICQYCVSACYHPVLWDW
jgi:hypothetical protein